MRVRVPRLAGPISVISGVVAPIPAAAGVVRIAVDRREPQHPHSQLVEIPVPQRRGDAGEVAAVPVGNGGDAAHPTVIQGIPVAKAIGEYEVERTITPLEGVLLDPHRDDQLRGAASGRVARVDAQRVARAGQAAGAHPDEPTGPIEGYGIAREGGRRHGDPHARRVDAAALRAVGVTNVEFEGAVGGGAVTCRGK